MVSTSGSSGIAAALATTSRTTPAPAVPRRRARRRRATRRRRSRRGVVPRVDLGERLAALDAVAALRAAGRPTAWSISSSFVRRRPAPSWSAPMPTASAPTRATTPSPAASTARRRAQSEARPLGDRRPAPRSSARTRLGGAVADYGLGARTRGLLVEAEVGEREQPRRPRSTSSVKSGGPSPRSVASASRISSALPTARPSGWSMSVRRQTTSRPARVRRARASPRRARAPPASVLHEGAVADLDVEHDRVGARGDLLRHDARGDQRDRSRPSRSRRGARRALVGGHEVGGLADDREPDVAAPARRTRRA